MNLIKRFFSRLTSLLFDSIVRLLASEKSPLTIKMAARNIQRHRGKSLIIGSILFVGAFLMTIGNGVISGMNRGLQKNVVEGFSGDIILVSDKQESDNLFMDAMGKAVEPLTNYKAIDTALKSIPFIEKWLPMGKNFAMALNEDGGLADGVFVLGVNFRQYREFFGDNLKVIDGRTLGDNERGVLVPTGWRKQFAEFYGIVFTPDSLRIDTATLGKDVTEHLDVMTKRTSVIYMGMSADNATMDIRAPVRGIVKYRALNMIWGAFPILDIESYRECQGYFTADAMATEIPDETAALLSQSDGSLDDMFAEDDMVVQSTGGKGAAELVEGSLRVETTESSRPEDLDAGTFNLVLLRLKNGQNLDQATANLNKILKEKKLPVRAVAWKKAIGPIGSMAVLIKAALFIFIFILFFVAIIIIVNTLSMAAIERTTEIGMMRAVGARKGFIMKMFLGETAMLSAVFGGVGIVAGAVVVNVVALFGITTEHDMLQLLYGGEVFRPLLAVSDYILVLAELGIVTLLAAVYPVYVASAITPLDAISRE